MPGRAMGNKVFVYLDVSGLLLEEEAKKDVDY